MPSEDANAVKKEEAEGDFDEKTLSSLKKPANATPKSISFKEANVNKEVAKAIKDESEDELPKPTKKNASNNSDKVQKKVVKKEEVESKGEKGAEQNGKKRERKVYDLPGQKRDPPEERDLLRIFYESL